MKLKLFSLVILAACGILIWFGCVANKPNKSLAADPQIVHILERLSFGVAPGDIEKVQNMGIDKYLQSQLHPESIPIPAQLQQKLAANETLTMNPTEIFQKYAPLPKEEREKTSEQELRRFRIKLNQLREKEIQTRLARAIASPRQLEEVMVDFWFNHFNVNINKGLATVLWTGNYEEEAIRPHVLGHFRDLLAATAHHPAMLFYLDNWLNTDPNSPTAKGQFKGLNENYARELMELHTLGVDGGYTQQDVIALARILTGWGIDRQGKMGDRSGFHFFKQRHDFQDKLLLGTKIPASGIEEGEQALDLLARHPSTANHIGYKLAQYFVADEPPKTLVKSLAKRFTETDGDIRAVLETLFTSPEFSDPQYYDNKYKTPLQYVISAIRATGSKNPNLKRTAAILNNLGMPLYACPTPDGYKNTQEAWLNPDAMLRRLSFATNVARGFLTSRQNRPIQSKLLDRTLKNSLSDRTKSAIETSPPEIRAALMLGSPEMMNR